MQSQAKRHSNNTSLARWRRSPLGFATLFLAVFFALQYAYSWSRDTEIERILIDVITVKPSVAVIGWITPQEQVVAQGHQLVSPHARLSVLNGCDGMETIFLLLAALVTFPMAWRHKIIGMLIGAALIYSINQVRIVALYYAFRHDRSFFSLLHGYIGPFIIIVLACLFFVWWIRRQPVSSDAPTAIA